MGLVMPDSDPKPKSIDAASMHESDLRRHCRFMCVDGGALRLAIRPEFKGRRAILVDVSTSGIGFLLESALEAGTMLTFELKDPNGADTIGRIARVRHSRPHAVPADAPWLPPTPKFSKFFRRLFGKQDPPPSGEAFLVGCEFDRPLSEGEIKQLFSQLQSQPQSD